MNIDAILTALLIPFAGTALGSAFVFFMKKVNKGFEDFAKSWGCTRPLDDKPYC